MYIKGGCASARCKAGKVFTKWEFKPAAASCAHDIVGVAQPLERSSSERCVTAISETLKYTVCGPVTHFFSKFVSRQHCHLSLLSAFLLEGS